MKTIRNRERIKGQNGWHNRGFGTQGVKGGRINGIQTLKWHYKKGEVANIKGHDAECKSQQNYAEKSVKIQRK